MNKIDLDALALEYQIDYGTASGELDISDFTNLLERCAPLELPKIEILKNVKSIQCK